MNLNQRKNSKNKNLETDNFKRRLSEPDSIFTCIKNNYENQTLIKFVDLKFYLDKIHLENQLQSKGLNKYKEPLLDAMNSAAKILESFLKIYKGISPKLETDDDIKKFGILDWNKNLIGQNVDQENGMFEQGISFYIFFKIDEEDIMGEQIAKAQVIIEDLCGNPEVGLIILNPNIDYSQLSLDYLKIIMLHQFTHLIAF